MECTANDERRFWAKVNKEGPVVRPELGPCWVWTGYTNRRGMGYGSFHQGVGMHQAHRWSWMFHVGPIPAGVRVCHRCDSPPCVRPDHLFLGTDKDNAADRDRKGRHVKHMGSKHGMAKLDEAAVVAIRLAHEIAGIDRLSLAHAYGVTRTMIGNIVTRKHWRHVP